MVTALYRRYRPENFSELIGQNQVTDPLRTALRTNRVNHAYLFSGPRGCGKTTSARILARCLNCAEGPTDTPCGVCPSCIELSRDGGGSLDVVEIDAASHGGVEDSRDLRERAIFAPARDRYKIFILDEAHMVSNQGFNALLKIVEEPPEHVKFIFATTEPEKVIGTIRSRTHHYPFRLVPPAQMLDYVEQLCVTEGITAAPGVYPLVVRAGGGSVRDTLSLLDQLIAGSENSGIEYERAVALLGYTHASLLDEVVETLGSRDGAGAFAAVDRVIQTGQDPRRFVEDLLERLRDLIVVGATTEGAAAVLRGVTPEELEHLVKQAHAFGAAELSRSADVVNRALTDMTGATSPRLHLELMIARVLVPESDETGRGALARVERLERRIGVAVGSSADVSASTVSAVSAPPLSAPALSAPAGRGPSDAQRAAGLTPVVLAETARGAAAGATEPAPTTAAHSAAWVDDSRAPTPAGPVSLQQLKDTWPQILEVVEKDKLSAWMVVVTATVRAFDGEVLTLSFPSHNDVEGFKKPLGAGEGVSEHLRRAIQQLFGVRVKYIARIERPDEGGPTPRASDPTPSHGSAPVPASAAAPAPVPASATAPAPDPASAAAPVPAGARAATPPPVAESHAWASSAPASSASAARASESRASESRATTSSAASPAPSVAPRDSGRAGSVRSTAAAAPAPASVTGWDVAPIPQSAPPEPDEPEYITEEPVGGAPTVDAAPAPSPAATGAAVAPSYGASAPVSSPRASSSGESAAPSAAGAPPARSARPEASMEGLESSRVAGAPVGHPSVRDVPRGDASPLRGVPQNSRYGEAVVREILNAQFLQEETIEPRVTPRGGND